MKASCEVTVYDHCTGVELSATSVELTVGKSYDLNELAEALSRAGYVRCEQVEGVGQFALRGGILDVFSPEMTQPVRAEFFGAREGR